MAEKQKKPADAKLIKKLFQLEPLDWARYPNDTLVFIAPDGSKHKYTGRQLDEMSQAPAEPENENPEVLPADASPACTERQRGADSVTYPQGQE